MASIAPQATSLPAQIGTRYTVLEQLGRGGMAIVYRVRDAGSDADVALKQLSFVREADKRRKLNALFEREFYVLSQLAHPSIVQVYDFGIDAGVPFYTMELLDGGGLNSRAPLAYRTCCELAVAVCSALSFLHSRRYLHRDLSPRNVHCTSNGRAKLIDFGAMVPMGPARQLVGTPAFTAPEAIYGTPLDARTDLYSLGATLYYALTGRAPFVARTFEDLPAAWRDPPKPPSEHVPSIPRELDLLVLSLLRVEPAHRPRSAFEVMQRLAAIADIANPEAEDLSQAYLQTPTLIARDSELHRFQNCARRAIAGHGCGLWLEGAAGSGRSRLLDAWILEAKTLGMLTVRTAGGAAARSPFATVYDLAEQLIEAWPEPSAETARAQGVFDALFDQVGDSPERPRLHPLSAFIDERDKLSPLLTTFIQGVCRSRPVLIAVDDADRVDEASLAVLAALAHGADERALIVAAGVSSERNDKASPALDVLASHCEHRRLRPLTKLELENLFSSVFGPVPNVALVADRIAAITMGNPSAAMMVAQHMVDRQLIRYAEGSWLLPAELTLTELPADVEELLRARVANLPPLARRLAEVQALAIAGQFGRADYAELAGPDNAAHLDAALDLLVQRGVLTNDGDTYSLAHGGDRALLLAALSPEHAQELHIALAAHFASAGPAIAEIHHLLMAGATERALDRTDAVLRGMNERADVAVTFRMNATDTAATLETALSCAVSSGRPLREQHEIARMLVTMSIVTDNKLHARYADFWCARLQLDSGLDDYRSLDPSLPAPERLKRALEAAVARYTATPERDRVYRVDEALRYLARYVSVSVAIGARTRNAALLHSIHGMLEPFAPLSPLLHALWQNAVAAHEMNIGGCVERARERAMRVYHDLEHLQGQDLHYARVIRKAIAAALAMIEAGVGLPSAEPWLELIDGDPLQRINAMNIRRYLCIVEGDVERAEYYRTRAEVYALQSSTRQMFMPPLRHELNAHIRAGDLAGIKQVTDHIARLAEDEPGWLPQHYVAQGSYQRFRGDAASAQAAFERAIEISTAADLEALRDRLSWAAAIAGYVGVLAARGRVDDACSVGRAALAECEALALRGASNDLVRELAIAEAKSGDHARAAERLDRLIASREGAIPAHRIADYEARVRVAIEARDSETVAHYLDRIAEQGRSGTAGRIIQARYVQLLEEARRVGVAPDPARLRQGTEAVHLRTNRLAAAKQVANALASAPDAPARAQRALALLCEAAGGSARGWLYLAHEMGLFLAASQPMAPDHALDAQVRRYWQQLADADRAAEMPTAASSQIGDAWRSDEDRFCPIVLRSSGEGRRVGLALVKEAEGAPFTPQVWELASVLSAQLVELGDATGVEPE